VPVLAQTLQKKDRGATDTDSETVWHLLEGYELLRIDNGNVRGGMVCRIKSPP
jgi:hypothetical protein